MTAADVLAFWTSVEELGIEVWIDGGWAVDALLGQQTRHHGDLDIALQHRDAEAICQVLESQGYRKVKTDSKWNFVMRDAGGHEIDFHTFVLDQAGNIIEGIKYPAGSLTGSGTIDGRSVRCISPEHLVRFHSGYDLRDRDVYDVKALCSKFGIEMPPEYAHLKSAHDRRRRER